MVNDFSKAQAMDHEQLYGPGSNLTPEGMAYLERLIKELDVPVSRYEEAQRRYESVGDWLCRDESTLKDLDPDVYVQGSFRLGTPIRPVNDHEHYDIDLVCELSTTTSNQTQQQIKELLGLEIKLYAKAHHMADAGEGRRCWTLDYAEGAQFHLDALPALPDGGKRQRLLVEAKLDAQWSETAIAITDIDHPHYRAIHDSWPHSNPRGYTEWFRGRMKANFHQIREALALEAHANVEDIPSYRVKTPLQQAVQVLKRHRDTTFKNDPEDKPISVIITTLSGLSYQGERTVAEAVLGILERMDSHIGQDMFGNPYIANPTDVQENFADRWIQVPARRVKFYKWLDKARQDFRILTHERDQDRLLEVAMESLGERDARAAAAGGRTRSLIGNMARRAASVFYAPHKLAAPWPTHDTGWVSIHKVTWTANGFSRPQLIESGKHRLMKGAYIMFEAQSNVPYPYDIHWQITNTGREASDAGKLRGDFYSGGTVTRGNPKRSEPIGYTGTHTAQCFVVKDGHLVARSEVFIVRVR